MAFFQASLEYGEIAAISVVEVAFSTTSATGYTSVEPPTLQDVEVTTPYPGHWGLSGSVRNPTARPMDNVELFLFPPR